MSELWCTTQRQSGGRKNTFISSVVWCLLDRQAKIVQKSFHCTPLSMLDLPEKKIIATVPLCKGKTRQSLIDEASNQSSHNKWSRLIYIHVMDTFCYKQIVWVNWNHRQCLQSALINLIYFVFVTFHTGRKADNFTRASSI